MAHKRRLFGTFLAVFLGVAFLAGTLVLGDTLRRELRRPLHRGQRRHRRRRAQRHQARHRSRRGNEPARPHRRVARRQGRAASTASPPPRPPSRATARSSARTATRSAATARRRWPATGSTTADLNPYRTRRGQAPRRRRRGRDQPRRGQRRRPARRRHHHRARRPNRSQVTIVGIATFGDADGSGGVTFTAFTLEARPAAPRSTAPTRSTSILGAADDGRVAGRARRAASSRCCPRTSRRSPGRSSPTRTSSDINDEFLELLHDVPRRLRRHRAARRHVQHPQHVLDPRRPAHAGVRAAAGDRRQPAADPALGRRRGAARRRRRVGGRARSAASASRGLLKALFDAFGFALPAGGLAFTTVDGRDLARRRRARDARRRRRPRRAKASRVAPLAALRDVARRPHRRVGSTRPIAGLALPPAASRSSSSPCSTGGDRSRLGRARRARSRSSASSCSVRSWPGRRAGSSARPLPRLRGVTGTLARDERDAQPAPHRGHRVGADGRRRRRHAVHRVRGVAQGVDRRHVSPARSSGDLVVSPAGFGGGGLSPQLATDIGAAARGRRPRSGSAPVRALVDGETPDGHGRRPDQRSAACSTSTSPTGSIADLGPRQIAGVEADRRRQGLDARHAVPVTFTDGATERAHGRRPLRLPRPRRQLRDPRRRGRRTRRRPSTRRARRAAPTACRRSRPASAPCSAPSPPTAHPT